MEVPIETENINEKTDQNIVVQTTNYQDLEKADDLLKDIKELSEYSNSENVKQEFYAFSDGNGQIYRKYSLREVKPVIKPFQHMIKLKSQKIQRELFLEEHYVCAMCCKIFMSQSSYKNHIKRHSTIKVYTCSQCDDTFKNNKQLCNHKVECHKDTCFSCQECQVAFSDHYTYLLHTLQHMKAPYKCPECQVYTNDNKSIAAHLKIHFNQLIKCHICNEEVRQMRLQMHIKNHSERVECVECGKICKDKHSYKYHMTTHTGVKLHQCLYCGKGFASGNQVNTHTAIHTNVRRFNCDQCHCQFKQSTDLIRHKEGHGGVRYECDYCGKLFKQKLTLAYHIRHHTNYRPYKCPNCKLSFTTLSSLRSHIQYSHVYKCKFTCHLCDLGFRVRCQYLRHLRCKRHLQNEFKSEKTVR